MATPPPNVQAALTSLRERWGGAAPRWGVEFNAEAQASRTEVRGALAVAPQPSPALDPETAPGKPDIQFGPNDRAIPTGFRALDAILGLGGLPRAATTALHGNGTSGKTTLALQAAAQAQAAGGIVAYLDLARSLDPVEAAARGVRLEWLVVLTPPSLEEALAMSAMLLQDRTVDLLLLDLPYHKLETVLLFGNIQVTTQAMAVPYSTQIESGHDPSSACLATSASRTDGYHLVQ